MVTVMFVQSVSIHSQRSCQTSNSLQQMIVCLPSLLLMTIDEIIAFYLL